MALQPLVGALTLEHLNAKTVITATSPLGKEVALLDRPVANLLDRASISSSRISITDISLEEIDFISYSLTQMHSEARSNTCA